MLSTRLGLLAAILTAVVACTMQGAVGSAPPSATGLPPKPDDWVCKESPPPVTEAQIQSWCQKYPNRGERAHIGIPATISNLNAKNAFDRRLQQFLSSREYDTKLHWFSDKTWRVTGPYVGPIGSGKSYGVHPAVRIYYSPKMMDWLCQGRKGDIPTNAMIVKEMHPIDASLDIPANGSCMIVRTPPSQIKPTSWTVMIRANAKAYDGWYWANPANPKNADFIPGNPPILDESGVTRADFFGKPPIKRNSNWYPTGDLFSKTKPADVVTAYNLYGAYCLNCHASAKTGSTFVSMDNILTSGILYKHFPAPETTVGALALLRNYAGSSRLDKPASLLKALRPTRDTYGFSQPRNAASTSFVRYFGDLKVDKFSQALKLRLPAQTYDHHLAGTDGAGPFLTSDQCIGCHDATVSNDSTPHMLITDPQSKKQVNVSPYGEWSASPMGLAGRDPIFFSQLQSETNNLPKLQACTENTCLHCHGVMGQRLFSEDTRQRPNPACKALFAVAPPKQVPFGQAFRLKQVTQWQDDPAHKATYGNLARDGISCTVCHHISSEDLGKEATFTGNFVTGKNDKVFGPYKDDTIVPKPMQHALNVTPKHGAQMTDSGVCSSCHNILLPVFNNDGTPHKVATVNGQNLYASYEQTTHLEWVNSVFAKTGDQFKSCQDCHMPTHYKGMDLAGTRIANIESNDFPPTTERLPDADIKLTARDTFGRHSLHGLNIFLNEMFQQFPIILGARQIDYMTPISSQPALITGNQSMVEMARHETADIAIQSMHVSAGGELDATVLVTNKTGHYLPSGVGFRRLFIEFTVKGKDGKLLWASGRTNPLGAILDGTTDNVLPTEAGVNNRHAYQPHYQVITAGNQVQIYQELIKDSAGFFTTSFLRRAEPVKDNRIRGKGFDPKVFANNPSPYIQLLAHLEGNTKKDPYYYDPKLTGADQIRYRIRLTPQQARDIGRVRVRLMSQSIPPFYLQQRFRDAHRGPAHKNEIQRLYYLTSHLNTDTSSPIADWRLSLVGDCKTASGGSC